MPQSDSEIRPQDIELPLSSPDSPKLARARNNRPASIGDASQLFGGGSGSDDFFGPPPTFSDDLAQQASLFDPVPEEPANTSSFDHDPFAWPTANQPPVSHAHNNQQSPFLPNAQSQIVDSGIQASHDHSSDLLSDHHNPYSPNPGQPGPQSYNQDLQTASQNIYSSPNLNFDQHAFNDPARFASPVSSYPHSFQHTSTGLGISNSSPQAPYAQQQPDSDAYNPYAPNDTHPTTHNHYSSYVPRQPSSFNPHHPHFADLIPRSVSVNALSHSDTVQHGSGPPNFQRPKLVQSATNHSTALFHRPKVYDAYDPPAIRKKKPYAFNTTASLPASPALGGDGFPAQMPLSGPTSQHFPTSFTPPPPPPPPKQRSTSTPAHNNDPIQMNSIDSNDLYIQPPHSLHSQKQFVPSVYSNYQPTSSPLSQHPTSFDSDPYHSTTSKNCAPPSPQFMPNSHFESQYQDSPRQADVYQFEQPSQSPAQSPSIPCMPTSQVEDPYAPVPSTKPDNNYGDNFLLASSPAPANVSKATTSHHYVGGLPPTSQQAPTLRAADQAAPLPPSINIYGSQDHSRTYASITSGIHSSKQRSNSPLKMSVVAHAHEDEDGHGQQQRQFLPYQNADHSSQRPPQDSIDALSSATQKLSISTATMGPDSSNPEPIRSDDDPIPQTPPISLATSATTQLEGSFTTPEKGMSVPDVQIQPATPQISKPGSSDTRSAPEFDDVLADLTSTNHNQQPGGTQTTETVTFDNFDYGIPNTSNSQYSTDFQYGTEYDYDPPQHNMQRLHQLDLSQTSPSNQISGSPVLYNPYNAPLEPHNPATPSTPNGHASSQPTELTHSEPYRSYEGHSDYNLMGEASAYGSMNDEPQSLYGLEPESFTTDQVMASRDHVATDSPLDSTSEGQVNGRSAYNPYGPITQSNPDYMGRRVEDPMSERLKVRVPVASFGFGGKLITVFPTSVGGTINGGQATGFEDPYGSGGMFPNGVNSGTTVTMQQLSQVIPISDLQSFPGPLFMDGGSKSNLGKKRKEVVAWLDAKLDESEKELAFVQSTLVGRSPNQDDLKDGKVVNLQDKIILLKLLKLLVENEGKLSGTAKVDEAVRLVLQSMDSQPAAVDIIPVLSSHGQSESNPQDVIATYHTRSSHLDSIQALLSYGDRQKAVHLAVEQKMWPHALIIANSLGNDVWRETVKEFVRFEMGDGDTSSLGHGSVGPAPSSPPPKGRVALRTLYTLFAGAGPAAVDEFSPSMAHAPSSSSLSESHAMSAMPTGLGATQLGGSSRAPSPAPLIHPIRSSPLKIPNNVLHQWRSVVGMTISNRVPGSAPFLLRLGDTLLNNGRTYAAHISYLLSNGLMPQLTLDNGSRISLLGSPAISIPDGPGLDLEAVMLTEVLEFALSLSPVPKNLDQFIGIPHLQGYRLALGLEYATFGLVDRANKYCEALVATFKLATKPCPFYHPFLFEQIKTLSGRLSAAPLAEKGSSWITRKMPRPTLDNVWQTLEGRVHKFVAGDDDDGSNPVASKSIGPSSQNSKVLGPFSHYSSISPESVSGTVSRVQSSNDLGQISTQTTTSGLAGPFHHNATLQRPSSGAGYSPSYYSKDPRRASPSNQYEGSTLSPVDYASFRGQTSSVPPLHSYEHAAPAGSPSSVPSPGETVTADNITTTSGGWWESSNSYGTPANNTSQPVFESIADTPIADDGSGFIDPMASFGGPSFVSPGAPMRESPHPIAPSPSSRTQYDEDEEDLGFGNSSSRKQDKRGSGSMDRNSGATDSPSSHNNTEKNEPTSSETESGNKTVKNTSSTSWLGRWFKRDSGGQAAPGSGPVKANLGEDFSLVYDPETKRWVNKKAGASQSPSRGGAPPPPPTRAQTASPTSSMRSTLQPPRKSSIQSPGSAHRAISGVPPPPATSRSNNTTTAMHDNHGSGAGVDRSPASPAPSDLSPNSAAPLPSALPPSKTQTPPPPASSNAGKKPNAKKNIRSRYVEIR